MPSTGRAGPRIALAVIALAIGLSACDGTVVPTVRPSVAVAVDAETWAGAICEAVDQFSLGIGDLDTGRRSTAWNDFEVALSAGDAEQIDATANAVLGHLTQGARAANAALGFEPGFAAATEWWDLLDGVANGVRMLRDATKEGDPARVTEARGLIQGAVEAHYEQAFGQMRSVPLPNGPLPCA